MRDGEAIFAADLARSVGRLDWWNIKAEHTPYQWACQKAMFEVNPFGDRRADIRAATSTTHSIVAGVHGEVNKEQVAALHRSLRDYLKCYAASEDDGEDVDYEALKKVKGTNGGTR